MARKKQKAERRPAKVPANRGAGKAEARTEPADSGQQPSVVRRREVRPYVYAAFDLAMVVVWAGLLTTQLQSRHGWASALLWSMVGIAALMGLSMFVRNRWGWRVASLCCGALLLLWVLLVVTLLMSAAFLAGVYGSFGHAAAMGTLAIAALSIELVALVPAFQLKFLMTRAGRGHFGQEPLG